MGERWAGPGPGPRVRPAGPGPGPGPFAISGIFFQKARPEKITCHILEIVCLSMPLLIKNLGPLKRRARIDDMYNFPAVSCQELSWRPHW